MSLSKEQEDLEEYDDFYEIGIEPSLDAYRNKKLP